MTPALVPTLVYAALCAAGLALVWGLRLDSDRGGYADTWRTMDKWAHGLAGSTLCLGAVLAGVSAGWAWAITVATGWVFELVQAKPRGGGPGFFSWRDGVAVMAGATAAVGYWRLMVEVM